MEAHCHSGQSVEAMAMILQLEKRGTLDALYVQMAWCVTFQVSGGHLAIQPPDELKAPDVIGLICVSTSSPHHSTENFVMVDWRQQCQYNH